MQANPARFRIDDALGVLAEDDWEIRQYTRQVHAGDRAFVWRSGDDAGIVAAGWVVSEPEIRPPEIGTEFWVDRAEGEKLEYRARVYYERRVTPALLRRDLRYDPVLSRLSVIARPLGTVFAVRAEEAARIEEIVSVGGFT